MAQRPNQKYGQGVYPGTGVAQGGQQGRMNLMHNGASSTRRGGSTPAASQVKPHNQWTQAKPKPYVAPTPVGYLPRQPYNPNGPAPESDYVQPGDKVSKQGAFQHAGNWYFLNEQGRVQFHGKNKPAVRTIIKAPVGFQTRHAYGLPGSNDGTKAGTVPTPGGGIAPNIGSALPTPAAPNFDQYRDADYWDAFRGEQRGYDDAVNPLISELAGLQAKGAGGKTIYDLMYDRSNNDFRKSNMLQRDAASKQGLLRSGYGNEQSAALGESWISQQDELNNKYGQGRISAIEQQKLKLQQQFDEAKRLMALAAADRGSQNYLNQTAASYAPLLPQ